jgi:mycothiol synthase
MAKEEGEETMYIQQSDRQKSMIRPLPEGYTARPASLEDDKIVADLHNAYSIALIGMNTTAVEEFQLDWGTPGFEMTTSTRTIFAPDGQIAGYMEVWDVPDQIRMHTRGCVHPEHSGLGIASHLVEWAEVRARQSVPKAPEGARVVLLNQVLSKDESAHSILRKYGYKTVRHFFRMEIRFDRTPASPEWPDGITVRTFARNQDEWPTIEAIQETFRDHWGHIDESPEEAYEQWAHMINEDPDFDSTLWFLAVDGDEIAGAALCWLHDFASPEIGEVMALGIRRPWRRQGLGLALLHHAFGELHHRGQAGATLSVDASSLTGATRLYEKAGMHVARQYTVFEKELRPGEDLSTQSLD